MRCTVFALLIFLTSWIWATDPPTDSVTLSESLPEVHLPLSQQAAHQLILAIDKLENDSLRSSGLRLFKVNRDPQFINLLEAFKTGTLHQTSHGLQIDGESGETLKALRSERLLISRIILSLELYSSNQEVQKEALYQTADQNSEEALADLRDLKNHLSPENQNAYQEAQSILLIQFGTDIEKMAAAEQLGSLGTMRAISALEKILQDSSTHEILISAAHKNMQLAQNYQKKISVIKNTFSGLSLGSILILMALGLSVIFGLMGVINMAHGEFMMLGAFTTYVVSQIFKNYLPVAYFDYYFLIAIPAAFMVSALVGWICESLLFRRLYGRPFETILATWGLSLVLIQIVRIIFGDTLSLTPPSWLSGGWEIMPDLTFPANRVFIILFCSVIIVSFYLLVNRTRLGLLLRASTQDRQTAASLGVPVRRVDGLAFALGAGLAGLAGCAVPLFDKINPSMGQSYVVDSFMVVVLGGVGKLGGSIFGGLGLGFLSKYIEPFMGAVYGKVAVLALIVLFLQWKPSGLFPSKGRNADD